MDSIALDEFRQRFGTTTDRRRELCARFEEWLKIASSTGLLRRLWVYGSFVSDKQVPQDVDVLAMIVAIDVDQVRYENVLPCLDVETVRNQYEIDMAVLPSHTPTDVLESLLLWCDQGRLGGGSVVEVIWS